MPYPQTIPLAFVSSTGGYKGYGLAMMVEVFTGLLAGAAVGPNIRRWRSNDRPANLVLRCPWLSLPARLDTSLA